MSAIGDRLGDRPPRLNEQDSPCPVCGAGPRSFHDDEIHDRAWTIPPADVPALLDALGVGHGRR